MRKIKIAFIGTNYYSHAVPVWKKLVKNSDVFEIAGYVLPENERQKYPEKMKYFEGYRELTLDSVLSDPTIEAVVIETDEIYLTKYALMAANAGKHMHMEKPGGQDAKQFEKLVNTVKEKGVIWHLGYMYRYNPMIESTVQKAAAGEYGEITGIDLQMSCIHNNEVQEWIATFKGGMMFYLGCHLIDILLRVQGKPDKITAWSKDSGRFTLAAFEYPNGVSTIKSCDTEYGGFNKRSCVIVGSKKTVEIRPLEALGEGEDIYTEMTEFSDAAWKDTGKHTVGPIQDRYENMMLEFAAMVRGEKQNPYTPDYELELYKTIIECCKGV